MSRLARAHRFQTSFRAVAIPRRLHRAVLGFCLSLLPACDARPIVAPTTDADAITQFSILNALMLGRYEGVASMPDVLARGDFGLGTLDHLDGELIVLEGRAYQARNDGTIDEVGAGRTTPFAVVTRFDADQEFAAPPAGTLSEFESRLDAQLPTTNVFYAIRVDGQFASITLRSVPRQDPPFVPLAEAAKQQTVWTRTDQAGTLIGIRSPNWVNKLNVPGYHWHYLSADRRSGGHVLDCQVASGKVRLDRCDAWMIELDRATRSDSDDLDRDMSDEVERVERLRGAEPGKSPESR